MKYTKKRSCLQGQYVSVLNYRKLTPCRRIVDDHYEHALRLFKEKDTGVIRLQASVHTGSLKRQVHRMSRLIAQLLIHRDRKPVWTAFITHQILSPTWLSRDSPRVVHLADLQRYIFTEEYNPQKTPSGAHELTFIGSAGMFFSLPFSFLVWICR